MRLLKCLLVFMIGLTALMYAVQNIANLEDLNRGSKGFETLLNWMAFAGVTLCQFSIGLLAIKGGYDLFVARTANDLAFKDAKSAAIVAGGLSLLLWFFLSLMIGAGLLNGQSDYGGMALTRSFQLSSTSALTILFVNGVRD